MFLSRRCSDFCCFTAVKNVDKKIQNWVRVVQSANVTQKDSIGALHQNRDPLVQKAGLWNLAGVFRDPPSKIIEEVTS